MISVIILTRNEESRIKACLESVKNLAGEILIADSNSQDKTAEIAQKYGAKIFQRDFDNYTNQKNWITEKASGDWLLYLDADERVLAPLKEEIIEATKKGEFSAYAFSRRNIILGKEEKYGPFWPDWIIRLVKKSDYKAWSGEVHETLNYSGKLGYSKNSLLHLTHRNIDQIVSKSLNWANIDARLRKEAGHPKMTSWRFIRILLTETFHQGFIRKGFFSGTRATIDSLMQVFSLIITYAKLWEIQQPQTSEEYYNQLDNELIESNFRY